MKHLSLLAIFFYLCTFCQPPQVKAAVPLALVAAGALGAALVSTSAGTYYQQNGKAPEWVSATSNAAASAADAIFQPSYVAQAVGYLFSPSSLSTAQEYYAAKAAAVGAKIGDIVDFVNNSASSLYSSLRSLIDSIKGDPTFATEPSANSNIQTPSGVNLAISGNWGWAHDYTYDIIPNWKNMYEYLGMYNGAWYFWNKKSNGDIYKITDEPGFNGYAHYMRVFWCSCWPASSGNPASGGKPNYDALKSALANPNSDVINDIRDVVKALPASQQIIAGATPNTVDTKDPAPSITPNEIKQILAQNAADVAKAVADQLAAASAANASNTALQIAAAQAAVDAAKAAADAATPNPEDNQDEPNYPVPSSWYSGKCDPNNVSSCFNYQQILDATDAFKTTVLYQAPHLLLDCLDYVKGDGCEYPPRISINLFSRYSSEQTNIDLSPFQSAVKVMKFFFSLLCFICTYKAVMTLFR